MKKIISLMLLIIMSLADSAVAETAAGNRLRFEKSPYLLQHAHNPVNWYPWGQEAFDAARSQGKPIFLSVGYSTCHWCHVMREESFENEDIAHTLNTYFISIKVDREERPDVDRVYMDALQMMTGSGGWPMTLFLTHELKPFFAGTYFPPDDRHGKPGFATVLNSIALKWFNEKETIENFSQGVVKNMQQLYSFKQIPGTLPGEETLKKAGAEFKKLYDKDFGGFGEAPKFPRAHNYIFLLRAYRRFKDKELLAMTEASLRGIRHGGIYDHLGGGVHRYATDAAWFLPHFEKMLYDQALLSRAYLELLRVTDNPIYGKIAADIFRYVLRDLKSPENVFYSAEDADSAPDAARPERKKEGAFYLWEEKEIRDIFDDKVAPIVLEHYGVRIKGNINQDPLSEFKDKNVLHLQDDGLKLANQYKVSDDFVFDSLYGAKQTLFELRQKRPRPFLDDKVLTDWNGLMISSLAVGSAVLGEETYYIAAKQAADFILEKMMTPEGKLLHRYRQGEAGITGFLDDYAFFVRGLLDLYEAGFDARYLEQAKHLTEKMTELFEDKANGGFRLSSEDSEAFITPAKDIYDGALPSGNSVAISNILRLSKLLLDAELETKARFHIQAFAEIIKETPARYPEMLLNIDWLEGPVYEIVLAGDRQDPLLEELLKTVRGNYLARKVVVLRPTDDAKLGKLSDLLPFVENQGALNGKATAYVCQNYICDLPTQKPAKLKQLLRVRSGESGTFRLFG